MTTPDTLKATVQAQRTMFNKTTGRYVATLGEWTAVGTTRDEALFILDEKIQAVQRHELRREYLIARDGTVFCLYHTFGGWDYDIVHAGSTHNVSSCHMSAKTFTDAFNAMKRHWEQYDADCAPKAA